MRGNVHRRVNTLDKLLNGGFIYDKHSNGYIALVHLVKRISGRIQRKWLRNIVDDGRKEGE